MLRLQRSPVVSSCSFTLWKIAKWVTNLAGWHSAASRCQRRKSQIWMRSGLTSKPDDCGPFINSCVHQSFQLRDLTMWHVNFKTRIGQLIKILWILLLKTSLHYLFQEFPCLTNTSKLMSISHPLSIVYPDQIQVFENKVEESGNHRFCLSFDDMFAVSIRIGFI